MKPIIEVKNISKKYNINAYQGKYIALRDVLTNIMKKPFSFLKAKAEKVIGKANKEEFWALKDINFTVKKGEVIGIIGHNGAGKSTILKILSQITPPTTGEIIINGKIASLLEVGTGFHPELTGRENVFLNGAILGMSKNEIEDKFDEIVEFAGIEKFIDVPVKKYSSGMHVRLAFSVAAHMEPDILLVDEVLAVGDAEFQKKCLGKMDEVTKKSGRTIVFVSHDMRAIQNLCQRCILLKDGKIEMIGETESVINTYLKSDIEGKNESSYKHDLNKDKLKNNYVNIISAELTNKQGILCSEFNAAEDIYISINYEIKEKIENLSIDAYLYTENGLYLLHTSYNDTEKNPKKTKNPGIYISRCKISKNLLNIGKYYITIGGRIPNVKQFFAVRNALTFEINAIDIPTGFDSPRTGIIAPLFEWTTKLK